MDVCYAKIQTDVLYRLSPKGEVVISSQVSAEEKNQLVVLINAKKDVFVKNSNEFGCTNVIEMRIEEFPGAELVGRNRTVLHRRIIADILQEWRQAGIISDSSLLYTSPILLVNKNSGKKRIYVDYQRLNQQTVTQLVSQLG